MNGSRVKKNEEIKRYDIGIEFGGDYVPTVLDIEEYEHGDWCKASDITLMIEQMGGMKDLIEKLTEDKKAMVQSIIDELRSVKDFDDKPITELNYLQGIRVLKEKIKDLEYRLDMSQMFEENAVMNTMDRV